MSKKVIALLMILLLSFPVSAAEKSVSVQIPVSCIGKNSSETFQYQILSEASQSQMLESDTLSLKDGETGSFQITCLEPGTYHYSVNQIKGTDSSISYDETVYSVDVYVTEKEDGTMAAETIAYSKPDSEKKDCLTFINPSHQQAHSTPVDTGDSFFTGWILLMAGSFILFIILIKKGGKGANDNEK